METVVQVIRTKKCIECYEKLEMSNFNSGRNKCKSCTKTYMKEYYNNKKNIILERSKNYYNDNKEKLKSYSKNYYLNHKTK